MGCYWLTIFVSGFQKIGRRREFWENTGVGGTGGVTSRGEWDRTEEGVGP